MSLLNPFGLLQQNPLPPSPIYCESRLPPRVPRAGSSRPGFTPSRGPGNANLFFSARLGFIWCRLSSFALIASSSSLTRLTTLSAYRSFSLLPRAPSLLRSPFVRGIPAFSRSSLFVSVRFSFPLSSLTVARPLRLSHFHRAHTPVPSSARQHCRHRHRRGQYNRCRATLPSRRRSPRTGSLFVIVAYSIYCLQRFARRRGRPGGAGRY